MNYDEFIALVDSGDTAAVSAAVTGGQYFMIKNELPPSSMGKPYSRNFGT